MGDDRSGLLIFDGECGFCTSSARWVAASWADGSKAVPWQDLGGDGLAALGLTVEQAQTEVWWVDPRGRRSGGHRAVAKSLRAARGWKRAAGILIDWPPLSLLAAGAYPVVARHRHRLPGATPACAVSRPGSRADPDT